MEMKRTETAGPLVSVIIPTYNRPRYLHAAIESAVQQTYRYIEIIVSNDCGPEDIRDVVSNFGDARISYERQAVNLGVAMNTLSAVKKARGKYIAILNDDDIWEENFLQTLVPYLEADDSAVLAFSDHYIIDEQGKRNDQATEENTYRWQRIGLAAGLHRPLWQLGLVQQSIPMVMAAVFRASVIDWNDFPADASSVYDYWLTYLACRTGLGAYYHPERLTNYRVHPGAETFVGGVRVSKGIIYCYERFARDSELAEYRTIFRERYILAQANLGMSLLRAGKSSEAAPYLRAALHYAPTTRIQIALALSLLPVPRSWVKGLLKSATIAYHRMQAFNRSRLSLGVANT